MLERHLNHTAIALLNNKADSRGADITALSTDLQRLRETLSGDLVAARDLIVVGLVDKCERDDTLLLQVGLVNTGERLGDDEASAEVTGLQSGVLTGRTLTVVVLCDDEPGLRLGLPLLGEVGDGVCGAVDVEGLVGGAGLSVDSADEGVLGDVGKMALELEPGTGGGDGIGCALTLDLEKDLEAGEL